MSGQKINDMKCKQCGYAHPVGTDCPPNSSFAVPAGSAAGPHVAKGVCIVCGSALALAFWRGHPDNRKVHCNDCGSEVTQWMHDKKQPNSEISDQELKGLLINAFDRIHKLERRLAKADEEAKANKAEIARAANIASCLANGINPD